MVAVPVVDGVKVTEQPDDPVLAPTRVHTDPLKEPVTPVTLKQTDPVGVLTVPAAVSVTVAMQVEAWLTTTELGEHETLIEVVSTGSPVLPGVAVGGFWSRFRISAHVMNMASSGPSTVLVRTVRLVFTTGDSANDMTNSFFTNV